jgi:RNA polymerase sigma factor (sigma-70 family)
MAVSDEALLAGVAAGQRDAAAAFVRRFQARVYGLVITMVRDPGLAEDVSQEAFVRAWRHAATYDPRRGRVATWLLTIARNAAIDAIRMRRPEPLDPDVLAARLEGPAETRPLPDDRLRGAVAELPEEQRRALFMAVYLGHTAREISDHEGAPLGTIKSRIRMAMLKLHDALETGHEL